MLDVTAAWRGNLTNIDRLASIIANGPYDAVIVISPEDVPYDSGFCTMVPRSIPERVHLEDMVEITDARAAYRTDIGHHETIWELGVS